MKFIDSAVNRAKRYSIGREAESGRYYLSIPVSNRLVEYDEYYEISAELHDGYPGNQALVDAFAERCRKRMMTACCFFSRGRTAVLQPD